MSPLSDGPSSSVEVEEDIPDVVLDKRGACVFCKRYSTPPPRVKHPVHGLAWFHYASSDGTFMYESVKTRWRIAVSNPA